MGKRYIFEKKQFHTPSPLRESETKNQETGRNNCYWYCRNIKPFLRRQNLKTQFRSQRSEKKSGSYAVDNKAHGEWRKDVNGWFEKNPRYSQTIRKKNG